MEIIDDDIQCPESNKPLGFGMPKPGFDLLLKRQDALRIGYKDLAVRGESKLRSGAIEKPASDLLLEPLDVQAHGGLRQVHKAGGAGEAICLNDRNEGAQQDCVENHRMDFRMCITRMILTEGHSGWCRGVAQRHVPDQSHETTMRETDYYCATCIA